MTQLNQPVKKKKKSDESCFQDLNLALLGLVFSQLRLSWCQVRASCCRVELIVDKMWELRVMTHENDVKPGSYSSANDRMATIFFCVCERTS